MRISHYTFQAEEDPKDVISWIGRTRRTGRLVLHFNEGGLRRPLEWSEKVKLQNPEVALSGINGGGFPEFKSAETS